MWRNRMSVRTRGLTAAVSSLALAGLIGCSSGGGSSDSSTSGSSVSFSFPSSVSVIQSKTNGSSSVNSGMAVWDAAGTDYAKIRQDFDRVNHPVGESLSTVKNIVCFIGLLGANTMWDDTKLPRVYLVGVDDSTCDESKGQPTQGASSGGSGATAKEMKMVTVRLSREAPGAFPRMEIWFTESDGPGGSPMEIRASADVYQEPNQVTAPNGRFKLSFNMVTSAGVSMGGGTLVMNNSPAPISYTFYEGMSGSGFSSSRGAAVEQAADGTGLKAAVQYSQTYGSSSDAGAWVVATNSTSVKANNKTAANANASSVTEIDLTGGVCLSLQNFKYRIYGYGLFRESDGSAVVLNTGVGCRYTDGSGNPRNCHVGKFGAWFERETSGSEHTLTDGETVTRQEWGQDAVNNGQTLTLGVKSGKLTKYTVRQYNLTDIAGVELRYFDSQASPPKEYIVEYRTTPSAGFYKTDELSWGNSGPTKTAITPAALSISGGSFVFFYSESYGGVTYVGGDSYITAREEQVILPTASDFSSGGIALKCLGRCLKGGITSTNLQTWSGPYQSDPGTVGAALDYYFDQATMKLHVGTNNSGTEVALTGGASFTDGSSQFQWGLESGAMVTSLTGLSNLFSIYGTPGNTYYQYRMGPNSWDKLILVRDSNNNYLTFDDPMPISYTHSTANDRNGDTEFDGKKFFLRYRGLGQMDGLPWDQIDRDGDSQPDMWVPRIALKDGIQMTSASVNYRLKAMFGEKTLTTTGADCSSLATLSLPQTAVPSSAAGSSSNVSTTKPDYGTCTYDYETDTAAGCN